MELCRKCKERGEERPADSRDHIIPDWIARRAAHLGIILDIGTLNYEKLCTECNRLKGGGIDMSHPVGYAFWSMVRRKIDHAEHLSTVASNVNK